MSKSSKEVTDDDIEQTLALIRSTKLLSQAGVDIVVKIADRAKNLIEGYKKVTVILDVFVCHVGGNPLRFQELLEAPDFDFTHDVMGINQNLNHNTGKLEGFFEPRFTEYDHPKLKYPFYVYLHTNGNLIDKVKYVVDSDPQYFDSDFVVQFWLITCDEDLKIAKNAQTLYKKENNLE